MMIEFSAGVGFRDYRYQSMTIMACQNNGDAALEACMSAPGFVMGPNLGPKEIRLFSILGVSSDGFLMDRGHLIRLVVNASDWVVVDRRFGGRGLLSVFSDKRFRSTFTKE